MHSVLEKETIHASSPQEMEDTRPQRLEFAFQHSSDLIFSFDSKGRLLEYNKAAEALFGNSPADAIGRAVFTTLGEVEWALCWERLQSLRAGESMEARDIVFGREGAQLHLTIWARVIKGGGGHWEYLCFARNETTRRNLECQLQQALKMECVGQLIASVAHDYNNMLMVIQGHLGMLTHKEKLSQPVMDSLMEIGRAANRGYQLNKQLLMFSRKHELNISFLNVNAMIEGLLKMLRRLIDETIQIRFEPNDCVPAISADQAMIEQVVVNLCTNARDALPKGGTITIRTDFIESEIKEGDGVQWDHGNVVCIEVKDTGSGMDGATKSRIFEPFFSTKQIGRGTGLGLATAKGIIKRHKGVISVESEAGKGTTFRICLPASKRQHPKVEQSSDTEIQELNGSGTVLLVEDDLPVQSTLHLALSKHGYRVFPCASSRRAQEIWRNNKDAIDLLFVDIVIPGGLLGDELAMKLVQEKPGLKVLFTTGYSDRMIGKEIALKSNERLLLKPYNHVEMLTKVRELLLESFANQRQAF